MEFILLQSSPDLFWSFSRIFCVIYLLVVGHWSICDHFLSLFTLFVCFGPFIFICLLCCFCVAESVCASRTEDLFQRSERWRGLPGTAMFNNVSVGKVQTTCNGPSQWRSFLAGEKMYCLAQLLSGLFICNPDQWLYHVAAGETVKRVIIYM